MSASAVGGKGKNGDINQVPYRVLIINLKYQSTHSVCRRFVVISLSFIKSIGGNTGSRILT